MPSGGEDGVKARTFERLKQAVAILRVRDPDLVEEYKQSVCSPRKTSRPLRTAPHRVTSPP